MAVTIGLPRGLLHYHYGTVWTNFFTNLGANVLVSGETTKNTLTQGDVLDEVCVPLKVYFGHAAELCSHVDYLFVPRIVSVSAGDYNCPKIIGLPDMLRNRLDNLPAIIDVNVSLRQNRLSLYQAIVQAGQFAGAGTSRSLYAWCSACRMSKSSTAVVTPSSELRLAVIGHPYIVNDSQVSLSVVDKVRKLGATVFTADLVPPRLADQAARSLGKQLYWTHGRHLLGAALTFMHKKTLVDGVIFMTSFSCGPDSMIGEIIKQQANKKNMPFLMLSIDEHTAEAGLITRLEAFTDMLRRRERL